MDYKNQICAGCGQPLREEDDVVVCPECATPQHRACYEKNNTCVNAEKHGDFVWKNNETPGSTFPCPVCGTQNPADAAACVRCGQPFTANALPPTPPPRREISSEQLVNDVFFDAPRSNSDLQMDDDEREQVEFVLAQRAVSAAPGMTAEQAQETLCGHPLRQVMTFLASKALTYVNKFRALENGRALTWNWAAFLFSPYWFFYRKLYKPGIVVLTVRICLTLLTYNPITHISELMLSLSAAMQDGTLTEAMYTEALQQIATYRLPILLSFGVIVLLAVLSGMFADRLYHRHVGKTLTALKQEESRDAFLVQFLRKSSVSLIAVALSYAAATILPNLVMTIFLG